jgi:hypothetical protein
VTHTPHILLLLHNLLLPRVSSLFLPSSRAFCFLTFSFHPSSVLFLSHHLLLLSPLPPPLLFTPWIFLF